MARVLLINPNKWGRGITTLWVASHSAVLKSQGHEVRLFDCTFFRNWRNDEVEFNTGNKQYKESDYDRQIVLKDEPVEGALLKCLAEFQPDVIFWSAISSHIHGEGEYVNIEYGHDLISSVLPQTKAIRIAGGLQVTARPEEMFKKFPHVNFFIRGESEFVLAELVQKLQDPKSFLATAGLVYKQGENLIVNPRQEILSNLSRIPQYDYSLFEDQVFLRPYNGRVVRAADYEFSRGCIYTCSYCVETVIQRYYGFTENVKGTLKRASQYLRAKTSEQVILELTYLNKERGVELLRCQDTNFLTVKREVLESVAKWMNEINCPMKLYIETRPDGINEKAIELLKSLCIDGIGMGIELAAEDFRENNLNRFSPKDRISNAFQLLRKAGIKRTAYNIIGLPNESEDQILETIRFNNQLDPDNITVAFYSPYIGTGQQAKGTEGDYFEEYEHNVDGQLRSVTKSSKVSRELLDFYKRNFVQLAREGLDGLSALKKADLMNPPKRQEIQYVRS